MAHSHLHQPNLLKPHPTPSSSTNFLSSPSQLHTRPSSPPIPLPVPKNTPSNSTSLGLPLASSLASLLLSPSASLPRTLLRPLSLLLIRELALLEHVFVRSPFHPLFACLAPQSSPLPFLASLSLGLVPLYRLWRSQPFLLVNLLAVPVPILRTLRALAALRAHPPAHPDDLTRWVVYWLLYAALATLEAIKLPRPASAHPTIYPALPTPSPIIHRLSRLVAALRPRPTHHPPTPSLATPVSPSSHFFGANSVRYVLLKLIFLRWCAADGTCGAMKIWNAFLAPLVELTLPDSRPPRKVIRVVVCTDEDTSHPPQQRSTPSQPEQVRRTHSDPIHKLDTSTTPLLDPSTEPNQENSSDLQAQVDVEEDKVVGQKLESFDVGVFRTPENAWESVGEVE